MCHAPSSSRDDVLFSELLRAGGWGESCGVWRGEGDRARDDEGLKVEKGGWKGADSDRGS
jgi:hypothetical protein